MNNVCLIGRLTRDPELRSSNSGMSICRFTLAVDRSRKQPGGPTADFINCVAFGKTGETISQYVHKGNRFAITGHLQTGSYENQQGQRVYTTDVIVDNFTFCESRNEGAGNMGGYQNSGSNNWSNQGSNQSNQDYYGGGFSSQPAYNSYQSPNANSSNNGGYSKPASGSPFGNTGAANDFDSSFDDADGLDIASDDLPF